MHVYIYNILCICAYLQGICESLDLSWFPMQIPRYCYLLCDSWGIQLGALFSSLRAAAVAASKLYGIRGMISAIARNRSMSFHHASPYASAHHVPWVYLDLGLHWFPSLFIPFLFLIVRDSEFAQLIWCSLDLDQARLIWASWGWPTPAFTSSEWGGRWGLVDRGLATSRDNNGARSIYPFLNLFLHFFPKICLLDFRVDKIDKQLGIKSSWR